MNGQLLEARADASALLEPTDALLDDMPLAVGLLVEDHIRVVPRQRVVLGLVRVPPATFLAAPAAARAARTEAPSTHHRSQSIRPALSSLICNASRMAAKTPALRQLRKWSYTVCHGPKRGGRSRQG